MPPSATRELLGLLLTRLKTRARWSYTFAPAWRSRETAGVEGSYGESVMD
jgi:hypothetical protein